MDEMKAIPGGAQIVDCIQCGTCSGSCPTSYLMHHTPRRLIAMTRAGMRKEVLESPDIWLCTSCYYCYVRCPRGIKVTDLMYAYKRLSAKGKYGIQKRGYKLGKTFMSVVNKYGRNNELELLAKFFTFANPIGGMMNSMIGLGLFLKGRLPLKQHKIKDVKGFRKMVAKAEELAQLP
jgi:heterodisulfide reductase subunit C